MASFDPNNYIKLFRMDEVGGLQEPTYVENVVIIPAGKKILKSMFRSEYIGHQNNIDDNDRCIFSDEAIDLLIKFRHELDELFHDCGDILGIASVLWDDISRRLFDRGFNAGGKQCSDKWETLYSEYLDIARCDDEGRVARCRYFAAFESLYKIRSKYIDSKILEDITEYLSSRSESPSNSIKAITPGGMKSEERIEADGQTLKSLKNGRSREEFSTLSNEEESRMLVEAIDAAQKILEDNLRDSNDSASLEPEQNAGDIQREIDIVEKFCGGYEESQKQGAGGPTDKEETPPVASKDKEDTPEYRVPPHSEETKFCWDTDATQCFLDLRLYVETSRETKRIVLKKYKTIVEFVSQKMLTNGYKVSDVECRKKWEQLIRCYNKEVKRVKNGTLDENELKELGDYFWQMDRVLKKSGLKRNGDNPVYFCWDEQSIRKLIGIRIPMENAFAMFKRYAILWQYVASQMRKHNFQPTDSECSIKWMELYDIYEVCLDCVKRGTREENILWIFYQDMRRGFEQNARSTHAVINYNCGSEPGKQTVGEEESTRSLAPSAFFSGSETLPGNESETQSRGAENRGVHRNPETDVSQNILETAIHHCNLLENIIKRKEANVPDNAAGEFRGPEPIRIESDGKRDDPSLRDSRPLLTMENNSSLEAERPETSRIEVCGAPLLESRDSSRVKERFEQTLRNIRLPASTTLERVENLAREKPADTACNASAIVDQKRDNAGWTIEATMLMIQLRMSRELKFRNSRLYLEMDLWKEIAMDMQIAGHKVCHSTCATRWYQLMVAYKSSPTPETAEILRPEYREQLKLAESPFPTKSRRARQRKTRENADSTATRFAWTEDAVKKLLACRFSEEIRNLKKYSLLVANKMRAAGYHTITSIAVGRKWSRISHMYRESLFRREMGEDVKWQYFELVHSYMKSSASGKQSEAHANKVLPFSWTENAVQKLIDFKLSLEESYDTPDRKALSSQWKKVAYAMVSEGFQVTRNECAMEWNFLIKTYMKTKRELCQGSSAVVGKYFVIMEKALNAANRPSCSVEEIEEPIDFSTSRKEKRLEDTSMKNNSSINQGRTLCKRVSEIEERCKTLRPIDENVMNLSQNVIPPTSNRSPMESWSGIEESFHDSSINKEKEALPMLRSAPNGNQQEADVPTPGESRAYNMGENYCDVHSSKENVAWNRKGARNRSLFATASAEKGEGARLRIFADQKPWNSDPQSQYPLLNLQVPAPHMRSILIQDGAIHSTENMEEEETKVGRWSEASIDLLIDSQLQHIQKHPGWPRPEIQWEEVASHFQSLGYDYTPIECRRKWYSLKSAYEQNIAEIKSKETHPPYYEKMNSYYNKLGSFHRYSGFISQRKRSRDNNDGDRENHSTSPKRLAVSSIPPQSFLIDPNFIIFDIGNARKAAEIAMDKEKMIE